MSRRCRGQSSGRRASSSGANRQPGQERFGRDSLLLSFSSSACRAERKRGRPVGVLAVPVSADRARRRGAGGAAGRKSLPEVIGQPLVQRGKVSVDRPRGRRLAESTRARILRHVFDEALDLLPSPEEPCARDRATGARVCEAREDLAEVLGVNDGEVEGSRVGSRIGKSEGHVDLSAARGGDCASRAAAPFVSAGVSPFAVGRENLSAACRKSEEREQALPQGPTPEVAPPHTSAMADRSAICRPDANVSPEPPRLR
jgi:hypothetical protein